MPSKEQLERFGTACRTLSATIVAGHLDTRLRDSNPKVSAGVTCRRLCPLRDVLRVMPQIVVKALAVIEHLATAPGCEPLSAHLANNCDEVLEVLEAPGSTETVRSQARKVCEPPLCRDSSSSSPCAAPHIPHDTACLHSHDSAWLHCACCRRFER
jgi:hypothetical protein